MTAPHRRARRVVALFLIAALGGAGAVVATSTAQAVPAPPTIQAPLDDTQGIFSVTVDPADHPVEQIVTVYHRSQATGFDIEGCSVVVPANTPSGDTFPCNVSVPPGVFGFYDLFAVATDVDGDSARSNTIASVRYGAAADPGSLTLGFPLDGVGNPIDFASQGGGIIVTGQGPALGTVDLYGYPDTLGPAADQLLTSGWSVDSTGYFSILHALPNYGVWQLRVVATDILGGQIEAPGSGATVGLFVFPDEPNVGITVGEAAIDVSLAGFSTSTVGAALTIDAFVGGSGEVQACPVSWDGVYDNASFEGPFVDCTYSMIPPGVHQLDSVQWADGVTGKIRTDLLYVPGTSTLTVETFAGGATYSGTIDRLTSALAASGTQLLENQVEVLDSTDGVRCFAAVDPITGDWSCSSQEDAGDETFVAVVRSNGFADDTSASGEAYGYISGVSDRSLPVLASVPPAVIPSPPTMSYGLGPASIDVSATGVPNGAISVELYQISDDGEGGYTYGDVVDWCGFDPDGGYVDPPRTGPSSITNCAFAALAPGIWNVYSHQTFGFETSEYRDDYILIPARPSLGVTVSNTKQLTAGGTGEPGNRVIVRQLGGDLGCTATVRPAGTWSCIINGVEGDVILRAQQQSQGFVATPQGEFGIVDSFDGYSAFTTPVSVSVPTTPVSNPAPLVWTLLGYEGGPLTPGQELELSAQGLPPQTDVSIEIRSTPQLLGTAVADDLGAFSLTVTVPENLEPGDHTLVATATPPGAAPSVVAIPVSVVAETPAGAPAPETAQQHGPRDLAGAGGGAGAGERSNPAAPSILTDSIPTLQRIFNDPWVALGSGGLALAILLLVAFPAELLNSTLSRNTGRLGRWIVAFERKAEQVTDWFARVSRTRATAAAVLVAVTSVIFGFVDPNFGFDPVSARTTVSLAIGLFLITYGAAWITGAIASRVWKVETTISLEPVALLFAVVGVIVARLLEFSPGFLIGLVIGLDLVSKVDAAVRARVIVLSTSVVAGVAVAAWIGYSALTAVSTGDPGWFELLIHDALVATAAEGLTAALASLLPLGFLAGHDVFRHSKPLWAGTFVVIAALFALIVLPTAQGATASVADMTFWIIVMVIFAVVTLIIWAVLHYTGRSSQGDGDVEGREVAVGSSTQH